MALLWKVDIVPPALGTKPGTGRSLMNEQMPVIVRVGLQPTACHEPGNAGEREQIRNVPQGMRSADRSECRKAPALPECRPPGRAGNDPSEHPSPWLWAMNKEEKKSRAGCLLLQLPGEEHGPLVGAGIVGHAPEPGRLHIS